MLKIKRISYGQNPFAWATGGRITEFDVGQIFVLYFKQGEVCIRIGSDDFCFVFFALESLDINLDGFFHDVIIGNEVAVRTDEKSGSSRAGTVFLFSSVWISEVSPEILEHRIIEEAPHLTLFDSLGFDGDDSRSHFVGNGDKIQVWLHLSGRGSRIQVGGHGRRGRLFEVIFRHVFFWEIDKNQACQKQA